MFIFCHYHISSGLLHAQLNWGAIKIILTRLLNENVFFIKKKIEEVPVYTVYNDVSGFCVWSSVSIFMNKTFKYLILWSLKGVMGNNVFSCLFCVWYSGTCPYRISPADGSNTRFQTGIDKFETFKIFTRFILLYSCWSGGDVIMYFSNYPNISPHWGEEKMS